jgi:hypothetical protein
MKRDVLVTFGKVQVTHGPERAMLTIVDAETNQTYIRMTLTPEQIAGMFLGDLRIPVPNVEVTGPKENECP